MPLSTLEMQKKCTQYLRIGGDQVMAAAEALYQKGLISYPRTETDQFDQAQDLMVLSKAFHLAWPPGSCGLDPYCSRLQPRVLLYLRICFVLPVGP